MDRFNSREEMKTTPLSIAKDIIYSDGKMDEKVKQIEDAIEKYARLQVRRAFQSIIDYEHENGRTPICNDEERGATEYAEIFFSEDS